MLNKRSLGNEKEELAVSYLKEQKAVILARNFYFRGGEIDLIAREKETLVMIEVKTRAKGKMGEGEKAVNQKKRQHLRYAAARYLQSHPTDSVRFDVIEISAAGIRHIKNAF